jgi:hypothetical protein
MARSFLKPTLALAACAALAGLGVRTSPAAADKPRELAADTAKLDFAKDIEPILKESCVKCHKAPDKQAAGGPGGAPGAPGGGPGGPGGPGGRPRGPAGGLRLDDKDAALKGGKHGKAIVPGKAEDSLLYKVLKGPAKEGNDEIGGMPKQRRGEEYKPLADEKVQLIKTWIDQGANWPAPAK